MQNRTLERNGHEYVARLIEYLKRNKLDVHNAPRHEGVFQLFAYSPFIEDITNVIYGLLGYSRKGDEKLNFGDENVRNNFFTKKTPVGLESDCLGGTEVFTKKISDSSRFVVDAINGKTMYLDGKLLYLNKKKEKRFQIDIKNTKIHLTLKRTIN